MLLALILFKNYPKSSSVAPCFILSWLYDMSFISFPQIFLYSFFLLFSWLHGRTKTLFFICSLNSFSQIIMNILSSSYLTICPHKTVKSSTGFLTCRQNQIISWGNYLTRPQGNKIKRISCGSPK